LGSVFDYPDILGARSLGGRALIRGANQGVHLAEERLEPERGAVDVDDANRLRARVSKRVRDVGGRDGRLASLRLGRAGRNERANLLRPEGSTCPKLLTLYQ
jgi:aminoglycoside N3'-acetyltransferase